MPAVNVQREWLNYWQRCKWLLTNCLQLQIRPTLQHFSMYQHHVEMWQTSILTAHLDTTGFEIKIVIWFNSTACLVNLLKAILQYHANKSKKISQLASQAITGSVVLMEHQYKHTVIWDVAVKVVYNYRTFICWPYLFDCQTTVLMSAPLLLMCAIVWMLHILCNRASYRLSSSSLHDNTLCAHNCISSLLL